MARPTPTIAALASTGTTTFIVVLGLLIVAAVMIGVAVWLVRATRRDPPALAPLERMGDRSWRAGDAESRAAALTAVRAEGAVAPGPMLDYEAQGPQPEVSGLAPEGDDAEPPIEPAEATVEAAPDVDSPVEAAPEPEPETADEPAGDPGPEADAGYARDDG